MLLLKIKALSIFANFEVSLGGFLVGFIFNPSLLIIPKRNYPGSTHFPFLANALGLNQPEKLYYHLSRGWAHTTGAPSAQGGNHTLDTDSWTGGGVIFYFFNGRNQVSIGY